MTAGCVPGAGSQPMALVVICCAAGQADPGAHPERHRHQAQRVPRAGEQQRRRRGRAYLAGLHVAARGRLWSRRAALDHQARSGIKV